MSFQHLELYHLDSLRPDGVELSITIAGMPSIGGEGASARLTDRLLMLLEVRFLTGVTDARLLVTCGSGGMSEDDIADVLSITYLYDN